MKSVRRWIAVVGLTTLLATAFVVQPAGASYSSESQGGFNDEYIFATTKAVHHMDANPALKLTLYPVTVVLDTALLPFAVIAGFVT